ncbi:hypothetical protein VTK26DRAFT_6589 [Humicola hyalothermophila]
MRGKPSDSYTILHECSTIVEGRRLRPSPKRRDLTCLFVCPAEHDSASLKVNIGEAPNSKHHGCANRVTAKYQVRSVRACGTRPQVSRSSHSIRLCWARAERVMTGKDCPSGRSALLPSTLVIGLLSLSNASSLVSGSIDHPSSTPLQCHPSQLPQSGPLLRLPLPGTEILRHPADRPYTSVV